MNTLTDYFDSLPLNEKEKHVLAVLYERGPIPVSRLANIAKTERTLTYKIVKELERKNYAHGIKMDKGLVYKAQDIETVIFEQERRLQKLRTAEKFIKEKRNSKQEATDIIVFEGDDGIRKALYYGMEQARNDEMLGIYGGTLEHEFVKTFNERHKFNRDHGIRSRIIFPGNTEAARDFVKRAKENGYSTSCRGSTTYDSTVEKGLLHVSLEIFQNTVKIYSFSERRAIIITDPQAVDMEKLIFTMLWESAKEIS